MLPHLQSRLRSIALAFINPGRARTRQSTHRQGGRLVFVADDELASLGGNKNVHDAQATITKLKRNIAAQVNAMYAPST